MPFFKPKTQKPKMEVYWGPKDKPALILRELDKLDEKLPQLGYERQLGESAFQNEWNKFLKEDKTFYVGCGWDTKRCCVWIGELKRRDVAFYTGLLAATVKLFPNITDEWGVEYPSRYFTIADYSGDVSTLCDDLVQALDILERGAAAF